MSNFIVKTSIVVYVPESFRKELCALIDEVERNSSASIEEVIDAILSANPESSSWEKYDGSIRVKFVEGE